MTADILLVEDNPDDAELVRLAFARFKITNSVEVIEDGEEALEYIFATGRHAKRNIENMPKVILLDIKLPFVDGLEVLERIKADPRTKRTPVVMLTSSNQENDRLRGYDLGANSYIVKPVDFNEFASAVRDCGLYWLLLNRPPEN